jgi:hypothetical protein
MLLVTCPSARLVTGVSDEAEARFRGNHWRYPNYKTRIRHLVSCLSERDVYGELWHGQEHGIWTRSGLNRSRALVTSSSNFGLTIGVEKPCVYVSRILL